MKIHSFVKKGLELAPIEVEVHLMTGTNQLQIMGLPDTSIKESGLRIKSALKRSGFKWPSGQQILVNLRPAHWRKTSRGLDLAIACAYLWESGQVPRPKDFGENIYVYGEVGLDGNVYAPNDLDTLFDHLKQNPILTGQTKSSSQWNLLTINKLKNLNQPVLLKAEAIPTFDWAPLPIPDMKFNFEAAELLEVISMGEHGTLLAGPAGSGKTTLAKAIYHLMPPPDVSMWNEVKRVKRWFGEDTSSRPFVSPHHTVTRTSMVGGGFPIFPGEITRAHGGLLLLDEFLEFHPQVNDALREPLESGEIQISRRGKSVKLPAYFHLIATTNLCTCGRLVPGMKEACTQSLLRCRRYLDKLSGPMLDRFDILAFSQNWNKKGLKSENEKSLKDIFLRVSNARIFREKRIQNQKVCLPNGRMKEEDLEKNLSNFVRQNFLPLEDLSRRRRRALLRISRTIADLELSDQVQPKHIEKATKWAWSNFEELRRIFS